MADVKGKVCRRHPTVAAATRCTTCFTPICEECIVEYEGAAFCSEECAEKSVNAAGRIADSNGGMARASRRTTVRAIVTLLLLALLGALAYMYYTANKAKVDRQMKKAGGQIQKARNELTRETKPTLQK